MTRTQNLQDVFINAARRDRLPVTIFLMNGFQLRGLITGFDSFTVVLDSDGKEIELSSLVDDGFEPAHTVSDPDISEEDLGEAVETDDMFDSYIEKDPDEIDFPGEGEYGESDSLDF